MANRVLRRLFDKAFKLQALVNLWKEFWIRHKQDVSPLALTRDCPELLEELSDAILVEKAMLWIAQPGNQERVNSPQLSQALCKQFVEEWASITPQ